MFILKKLFRSIHRLVDRGQWSQSKVLVAITLIVGVSSILVLVSPQASYALTQTATMKPEDQAKSFAYYKALSACMGYGSWKNSVAAGSLPGVPAAWGPASMSMADSQSNDWFNELRWVGDGNPIPVPPFFLLAPTKVNGVNVGVINDNTATTGRVGDGAQNCGGSEGRKWIGGLLNLWSIDGPNFLCEKEMAFTRQVTGLACNTTVGKDNDFLPPSTPTKNLDNFWKVTLGNKTTDENSINVKGGTYFLYYDSFITGCSVIVTPPDGTPEPLYTDIWSDPNNTGVLAKHNFTITDRSTNIDTSVNMYQGTPHTCKEIAAKLKADAVNDVNSVAYAYRLWLGLNKGPGTSTNGPMCINGVDISGKTCGSNNDQGTSCGIDGIGWIVCPAMSFLGNILGGIFQNLADNFLRTDIKLVDTNSGTYSGWSIFRNFANVAFVIVFLIIIFSQITSIGISNYGLKKMLPRLVIAAILVNASFYICQIAVDLSNVLGYSLKTVFDNIAVSSGVPTSQDASSNGFGITAIIVGVLATSYIVYASLAVLIPVLLGAIVAALMIVLMLLARKALIVILVVIAPLAFVAFLLPNTAKLFASWRKLFTTLLLLFPIVSVVFGASSLASQVIKSTASKDDWLTQSIAVGVAAIPLFFVPGLLKKSLDGVGGVGKALNGFAGKAGGGLGKAYSGSKFAEHRGKLKAQANAYTRAGQYTGNNPFRKVRSRINKKILNDNPVLNAMTGGYGKRKAGEVDKFENEKVQGMVADLEAEGKDPYGTYMSSLAPGTDKATQKAARSYYLKTMGAAAASHIYQGIDPRGGGGAVPGSTTGATARAAAAGPGGASGQYRTNASGTTVRPLGTSGGSGQRITNNEKAQIDAHTAALDASQAAYDDAINRGHTPEDAQAIAGAEYKLHDK